MLNGWVKLYRQLLGHWLTDDPEFLAVWVHMLLRANHCDNKRLFNGKVLELKKGQFLFGLNAWSRSTGVSVSKLRRLVGLLEQEGMVNRQKTNKFSVISIAYYESYQHDDRQTTGKNTNWIKLPRWLLNHRLSEEPESLALWVHMILQANHSNARRLFNGSMVELRSGDLLYSYELMERITHVSIAKQRRVIKQLAKDAMIDRQTTNKYSIISITSGEYFQHIDRQTTTKGQAKNTTSASNQQANDNTVRKKDQKDYKDQKEGETEIPKHERAIRLLIEHHQVLPLDAEIWLKNRTYVVFDPETWGSIRTESEISGLSIAQIAHVCRCTGWKTFKADWYQKRLSKNKEFRQLMINAGIAN